MTDISIKGSLKALAGTNLTDKTLTEAGKESFSQTLIDSIEKVNRLSNEAGQSIQDLMVGETKDIHKTMIDLEKAAISFQMMMSVRSKIVGAYEEIMRLQV